MSLAFQEKTIPVIGVPPAPPRPVSAQIKPPAQKPNPKSSPIKKVKSPVKPTQKAPNKNNIIKKMEKIATVIVLEENELILETGRPKDENGFFVLENEKKLTNVEKMALTEWCDSKMVQLEGSEMTGKQKKKERFKLRMIWLINKTQLMKTANTVVIEKPMSAKNVKLSRKIQRKLEKIQNQKVSSEIQQKASKEIKKHPYELKIPEKSKPKPLMDLYTKPYEKVENRQYGGGNEQQNRDYYYDNQGQIGRGGYQNSYNGNGGYQYLNDNWINSDKPWGNFQTSSSSTSNYLPTSSEFPSSYTASSSTSSMIPNQQQYSMPSTLQPPSTEYSSYQMTSLSTGYGPPVAPINYQQPQTSYPPPASSFDQMMNTFANPPPAFIPASYSQVAPEMSQQAAEPGYVSLYAQQFPPSQPPQQNVDMNFSMPQSQSSVQPSYSPFAPAIPQQQQPLITDSALEASEEELSRQRRLLEIEEELRKINERKMQMQMEEELQRRQFQMAVKQQEIEQRERDIRDQEYYDRRSIDRDHSQSSRHHHRYDDRRSSSPSSSGTYNNHYSSTSSSRRERVQNYRERRTESRRRQPNSSSSSSNPHQISIERNGAADAIERRHGQQPQSNRSNEMKLPREIGGSGGGEKKKTMMKRRDGGADGGEDYGSLKRPADYGNNNNNNVNIHNDGDRAGSIQPAVKRRRPRKKGQGNTEVHQEIPMQAISDDEA